MNLYGIFEIVLVLALVVAAAVPLGRYMADVFENRPTFLTPIAGPFERGFYRLAGVDPSVEQSWLQYALGMVLFGAVCFLGLYGLLRLQGHLPLNPQGFDGLSPDLAFNVAISFITNTNWQPYGGETTMSHFSQMAGLTVHNYLDTAAAIAIALGLIRALRRNESATIGNFWVDVTRATLYVLLPLCVVVALAFVALGVPQTLHAAISATTLEGAQQTIAIGPVASQEAIKMIGNNGGGFFNAGSAHPYENPGPLANMLQCWTQLVLPVAIVFAFGRMIGEARQARALLVTMSAIFLIALGVFYWTETREVPALAALGVDSTHGFLEGKDLRFGQAGDALFVDATTGTGTGASNAVLESMTPVGALVAMFNLLLGCISPGGVGTGLYSLLLLVFVAVFLAGLMIGRTPEYLGKKIATREVKLTVFALLISPAFMLGLSGAAALAKVALDTLGASGPHGLTEMLYAYASTVSDNGSGFAGLSSNSPWWNLTTGLAMLFGRFAHAVPILAIAGSLAAKKKLSGSAGTLVTDGPLFVAFLIGVAVIFTLLQYLPALALGPVADHLFYARGAAF